MAFNSNGIARRPKPTYTNTISISKMHVKYFLIRSLKIMDPEIHNGQIREAIVGMTKNWRLLFVVYTMLEDDILRIVSARAVTKQERKKYEEQ